MEIIVHETYEEMSAAAARAVAEVMNTKPNAVLGLATGSTPLGLYKELVRLHKEKGLDFSQVTTFNLDEYVGLTKDHPQSYHYFMHENLFQAYQYPAAEYLRSFGHNPQLRGVLPVVRAADPGMRRHRHPDPWDRLGRAHRFQRADQLARFPHADQDARQTDDRRQRTVFRRAEDVPIYAITMGVGTILEAAKIILVANGEGKAEAVANAVEGSVTSMCTASALQLHKDATVFLDRPASSKLQMLDYYKWIQEKGPGAPQDG